MESTENGDSVKGERIIVEFDKYDKFRLNSGSSKDKRQWTTFEGNVCCTIVSSLRRKIHKI